MCGFSGIIFSNRQVKESFLPGMDAFRKASPRVAHRGDTEHNEAILDCLWLSHYRLAFQDVASGAQPMRSQDGQHIIVFNGELYNHLALREKITAKTGVTIQNNAVIPKPFWKAGRLLVKLSLKTLMVSLPLLFLLYLVRS